MHADITRKKQLELFEHSLPHRPYCTDEKGWLQIRPRATAIKKRFIQHNPPCMAAWLVFDCDYAGALQHVGEQQLPGPNIVSTNPANGNSHLYYRLADPVCTSDSARMKPLDLLAKIQYAMRNALNADPGYGGFIAKNPLHEHWITQEVNPEPWNLNDFLEWIEVPKWLPKKASTEGYGRNCTLFHTARWWTTC